MRAAAAPTGPRVSPPPPPVSSPLPISGAPPRRGLPAPTAVPAPATLGVPDHVPTELRAALRARDWDAVSWLASAHRGHSCLRLPATDGGLTALHLAALAGSASACSALLAGGADADARDARQQTALHLAAGAGRLEAVKALLEGGAKPRKNADGKTPLHDAAWAGHSDVARALLRHVDVNALGKDGRSALHCASLSKDVALVRELVDAGANLNVVDAQGRTPLDWARHFGRASGEGAVANVLAQAGAVGSIEVVGVATDQAHPALMPDRRRSSAEPPRRKLGFLD